MKLVICVIGGNRCTSRIGISLCVVEPGQNIELVEIGVRREGVPDCRGDNGRISNQIMPVKEPTGSFLVSPTAFIWSVIQLGALDVAGNYQCSEQSSRMQINRLAS